MIIYKNLCVFAQPHPTLWIKPESLVSPALAERFLTISNSWEAHMEKCAVLRCSVMSNSLLTPGLQPTRLLCPWILQARILEWIAISSSQGPSNSEIAPVSLVSPALAGRYITTSIPWEAHM